MATFLCVLLEANSLVESRVAYLKVVLSGTAGICCSNLPAVVSVSGLYVRNVLMQDLMAVLSVLGLVMVAMSFVCTMCLVSICLLASNSLVVLCGDTCGTYMMETTVGVRFSSILENVKWVDLIVIVTLYVVIKLPLLLVIRFRTCLTTGPGRLSTVLRMLMSVDALFPVNLLSRVVIVFVKLVLV